MARGSGGHRGGGGGDPHPQHRAAPYDRPAQPHRSRHQARAQGCGAYVPHGARRQLGEHVTIKFVDVYGFAGGFSCGAAQEGMTLVGKKENKQGFGIPLMEANRKLLGNEWQAQASLPAEWTPIEADGVIGTPPCSAFSSMTAGSKMHGMDSEINNCMRDIMTYAAKVKPQFVCMESVAQAYTKGLPLMRELGRYMNEHTGLKYHVTHVLQNNWSVGGVSKRKRYFLVLTQFPFGVEHHPLGDKLPVLGDA